MKLYRVGNDWGFGVSYSYVQADSYASAVQKWMQKQLRDACEDGAPVTTGEPHEVALVRETVLWAEVTP